MEIESLQARIEILDAMFAAINNRERLMDVVGTAADADDARAAVIREFGFTDEQAVHVLGLQVRDFAASERERRASERTQLLERRPQSK